MDKNIIKIIEDQKNFNWYFNNRNYILLLGMLFLLVLTIYMSKKIKKINYKEIYGKVLAHTAIIIIIGTGLNVAGMEIEFAVNHMPILLFCGTVLLTTGIQIVECTRYSKNYTEVIKRANVIFIGIIECVVLILGIMERLEVIELVTAIVGCITLKTTNNFIDYCTRKPKYNINKDFLTEDYPISREKDLFDSRKRQLNSLCKQL